MIEWIIGGRVHHKLSDRKVTRLSTIPALSGLTLEFPIDRVRLLGRPQQHHQKMGTPIQHQPIHHSYLVPIENIQCLFVNNVHQRQRNLEIQAFTNELQIDNITNLTLRTQECNPVKATTPINPLSK